MRHIPVTTKSLLLGFHITRCISRAWTVTAAYGGDSLVTHADCDAMSLRAREALEHVARNKMANAIVNYKQDLYRFPGVAMAIASGDLVVAERRRSDSEPFTST